MQAHAICYRQVPTECDFGVLRQIVLPPAAISIPRTELPMEQLLSIHRKQEKPDTSKSSKKDEAGGGSESIPPGEELTIVQPYKDDDEDSSEGDKREKEDCE